MEVIIAAAGKAAHLAGVIAGHTAIPVIGLPIKSSMMDGLDSLLSTVQMPDGIPVATVAVNGAANAAILAAQILSVKYESLRQALKDYKFEMQQKSFWRTKSCKRRLQNEQDEANVRRQSEKGL